MYFLLILLVSLLVPVPAAARPNIVVIMTDDQDVASVASMQNLNTLIARQGVTFENSFTNFALCCPSRATFLTGQHSTNHGVRGNRLPGGGYTRLNHANTLPVWLRAAGYKTALVGKYLNRYGKDVPRTTVPPGWTFWHGNLTPDKYRNGAVNHNGAVQSYAGYNTDHFTAVATDFISDQSGVAQPFFLWLTYDAPHYPADPAARHKGRFSSWPLPTPPNFNEADVSDKPPSVRWPLIISARKATIATQYRKRLESLQAVDEGIARLFDVLRSTGKLSNTVVIFTSDNGYFQGHHRIPDHKNSYYEESIRVPLMIRGPGISANVQRSKLVSNIDLAPTIAALAGATPGLTMDGRSLLPLLQNPAAPWRSALFIDGVRRTAPLERGKGKVQIDAVRTEWSLYVEHVRGDRELYDLRVDPYQLQNRATSPVYGDTIVELGLVLDELKHCAGADCWITRSIAAPALR